MKIHKWSTIVLTILLGLAAAMFQIPEYSEIIAHPQFEHLEIADEVVGKINSFEKGKLPWFKNPTLWFKCFFALDFIWAAFLLSFLYRWIRQENQNIDNENDKAYTIVKLLLIFSIAAYLFDVFENLLYLRLLAIKDFADNLEIFALARVVKIKTFLYAGVFILVLVFLYQKYVFSKLSLIGRALKASIISLITIALLVILATLMDQGSTVIIHLLTQPLSLGAAVVLINLLALAAAHYPDYIDKYFNKEKVCQAQPQIKWYMQPMFGHRHFLGMGLITYEESNKQNTSSVVSSAVQRQLSEKDSAFFDHFRKITGLLVLVTWVYVLLYVIIKYKLHSAPLITLTVVLLILFLYLYFDIYKIRQYWRRHVNNNIQKIQPPDEGSDMATQPDKADVHFPSNVRFFLIATLVAFILLIISLGISMYVAHTGTWMQSWKSVMVTTFINIVFFILFQHFRTTISMMTRSPWMYFVPIFHLHKDLVYVKFFAVMGFLSLVAFVMLTYEPVLVNALVIILLFLYLIYGLIVVLIKHHLYYSSKSNNSTSVHVSTTSKVFFEKYVPIIGIMVAIWIYYSGTVGNGLHILPSIQESESLVTFQDYKNQLCDTQSPTPDTPSYLIASYGGGLRATAWTMLVMDTMEKIKPDLLDRTLAMSGVSGGFLGLSMYTAIRHEHPSSQTRMKTIDTVGKHNILSIDLAYLLGFDLIRELIPYVPKFCYRDRAGRSMQQYASLIQPNEQKRKVLLESSYRQYWSNVYLDAPNQYYPVLIGNTTGTHSRAGVAYSVSENAVGENHPSFHTIFPGASDILTLEDDESISYLDATSTTERFPIFSPTAQIEGKGHFLDGGYFENSGLLSLMNFYDYLQLDTALCLHDRTTKVILFINSKDAYIRYVLRHVNITHKELATGEMSAILETIMDIDILPLALEDRLNLRFDSTRFIRIYLPYPIEYDEVVDLLRGHPDDPFMVQDTINFYNQKIETILKQNHDPSIYPVPPALARVLSDPAYSYLKIMLKHPDVENALNQLR